MIGVAVATTDQLLERLICAARAAELVGPDSFTGRNEALKPYDTGVTEDLLAVLIDLERNRWPQGSGTRSPRRIILLDGLRFVGCHVTLHFKQVGCLLEGAAQRHRSSSSLFNMLPKEMGRYIYLAQCLRPLMRFQALGDQRLDELEMFVNRWAACPPIRMTPIIEIKLAIEAINDGRQVLAQAASERAARAF